MPKSPDKNEMKQNVRDEKPGPDKSRDVVGFKWILVAIEISAYGLHWQFFFCIIASSMQRG